MVGVQTLSRPPTNPCSIFDNRNAKTSSQAGYNNNNNESASKHNGSSNKEETQSVHSHVNLKQTFKISIHRIEYAPMQTNDVGSYRSNKKSLSQIRINGSDNKSFCVNNIDNRQSESSADYINTIGFSNNKTSSTIILRNSKRTTDKRKCGLNLVCIEAEDPIIQCQTLISPVRE